MKVKLKINNNRTTKQQLAFLKKQKKDYKNLT